MSEYVKNSISKNWSNVRILTSTTTYNIEKKLNILTTRDEYILRYEIEWFENLPMFWPSYSGLLKGEDWIWSRFIISLSAPFVTWWHQKLHLAHHLVSLEVAG